MDEKDINDFWNKDVKRLVEGGWDPPLAFIDRIMTHLKKNNLKVTNQDLRNLGKKVKFLPGVTDIFQRLKTFVDGSKEFQEAYIQIEFYIISGGFEEIIKGTPIANEMKDIFGCTFDDRRGDLIIKSILTFTEKTKCLYAINKGISGIELRRNPYRVNDVFPKEKRRIPFNNMIYLGDGPTDIPCFSIIQQSGGTTIGVLKYKKERGEIILDKWRTWAIVRGGRTTLGPYLPDYRKDSDLYIILQNAVEKVGLDARAMFRRIG